MEFRITIGVTDYGTEAIAERVLDTFLELHPEAGPVVEANLETQVLTVTFAIEVADADESSHESAGMFARVMARADLDPSDIVTANIELVEASAALERELQPA